MFQLCAVAVRTWVSLSSEIKYVNKVHFINKYNKLYMLMACHQDILVI